MCLVVIASRIRADFPLVVGANRDESFERPAIPMDVLRANAPRVLGGRDELGGATWLAVNAHGVVASLTHRPSHEVPDACGTTAQPDSDERPAAARAACVHADRGGTRWSAVITVGRDGKVPSFRHTDGPPCTTPYTDAAEYWRR